MASTQFERYGEYWSAHTDALSIEFFAIRKGGSWLNAQQKPCGEGLFFHFKQAFTLLWPTDDHHRWSDLGLRRLIEEDIVVLMGCGDSNKTYLISRFVLVDYWCFPEETLWLVSSTEYRGAELRIWGKIKELYNRARDRYDWLAGHVLESMHAITTEDIDDDRERGRSLQKGLILVPSKKGGSWQGLSAFVGVKAPRLRHAGDEVQHMNTGFLDAYANWYGKENFKGAMAGNPLDPSDPLCTAAEPPEGWDAWIDSEKTQEWRSKFFNAWVIAYDGRDSPNNDFDTTGKPRYGYLISRKKLDAVSTTHGKDSWLWFNQCVGKPNKGLVSKRIITRHLCEQHHALEDAIWLDTNQTSLYAIDPAYGGVDRCVGMRLMFGLNLEKRQILKMFPPEIIPVRMNLKTDPEQQIAEFTKKRLEDLAIPPENCFYDSFGRGTLGFAFAKLFGTTCPVPVDSGAKATTRPVRYDLFVRDADGKLRLKRCDEHYSKFITEAWYSVRETVESDQLRGLTREVMDEGCLRIFKIVQGNKIEVEPKDKMRERVNRSPDLFDTAAIGTEGARQRGFKIARIGMEIEEDSDRYSWLDERRKKTEALLSSKSLAYK